MKPDVVAVTPLYQPVMDRLEGAYTVHRLFEARDRKAFLAGVKDKAQGLACFGGAIDAALMDALPKLKIVACMSVGVDHVDLAAAKARGIHVTNAPDVLTDDVADIAIALLIGVARQIPQADRYVREGKWAAQGAMPLGAKLGGSTMGVLGLGRIGMAISKRAEALGVRIVYSGPRQKPGVAYRYYADLAAMAKDVDYLMVSCPGGAATRNLVNDQVISALGQKGVIVNIARGSVVDEKALVKALVEGRLRGAGLDVFADEPHVPAALLKLDNVVLLPHIGSATGATRQAMGQLMLDNLAAFYAGKPLLTPVA
jgi:hydroxypyruvate reductase